jgi:RimJ/RimL family protein N-acetyltransferase
VVFIEKKDGTKIGTVFHFLNGNYMEIGYILAPNERKKGYGSEAVRMIVDYLFLSKELVRVQAITGVDNFASQRILEKSGHALAEDMEEVIKVITQFLL